MRRDILMCLIMQPIKFGVRKKMLASLTGDVNGTTGLVNFLKTVSFWCTCKTCKWAVGGKRPKRKSYSKNYVRFLCFPLFKLLIKHSVFF